jgi:dCMP deaminase
MDKEKLRRTMDHARFIADYSKDRSTKVGALILGQDWEPLSWGYNGFPRGANDDKPERHERPLKYLWSEHAERNAIFNAARSGHELRGASIFVYGLCPCTDCSRAIIQSGISRVYLDASSFDPENPRVKAWEESWKVSKEMLDECGVETIVVE